MTDLDKAREALARHFGPYAVRAIDDYLDAREATRAQNAPVREAGDDVLVELAALRKAVGEARDIAASWIAPGKTVWLDNADTAGRIADTFNSIRAVLTSALDGPLPHQPDRTTDDSRAHIAQPAREPDQPAPADAPYYPKVIEYPDAGRVEFVLRDGYAIYDKGDPYDIILDGESRQVIGFAWPLGTNPATAPRRGVTPSPAVEAMAKALEEAVNWLRGVDSVGVRTRAKDALAAYRKEHPDG